jgi:hypothetical protein
MSAHYSQPLARLGKCDSDRSADKNMKKKRPKGITVLSVYLLVTSVLSINDILNPDTKVIMANHIITGLPVDVHYVIHIGLGIAIAIGLWRLKKWAALLFLFYNMIGAGLILINLVLIQKETLLLAGWKDYDGLLHGFRMMQAIALVIIFLLTVWLLAYRRHFSTKTLTEAEQ